MDHSITGIVRIFDVHCTVLIFFLKNLKKAQNKLTFVGGKNVKIYEMSCKIDPFINSNSITLSD
jgi:hypothetical protein